MNPPLLIYFDTAKPILVLTNASGVATGHCRHFNATEELLKFTKESEHLGIDRMDSFSHCPYRRVLGIV
jgi:hypothetical protein